jgi:sec-independent protein translocase protein TatB
MFDVGFTELFLLALIGLLVLGPERLPGVARTIGGFVRKARVSWTSLRNTIESELAEADISEPLKQASDQFKQIGKDLSDVPDFMADKDKPVESATQPQAEAGDETLTKATRDSNPAPISENSKDENV